MKTYESFKATAKRLVSITCDRCGVEIYRVSHQRSGTVKLSGFLSDDWFYGFFDLCPDCMTQCVQELEKFVGEKLTSGS